MWAQNSNIVTEGAPKYNFAASGLYNVKSKKRIDKNFPLQKLTDWSNRSQDINDSPHGRLFITDFSTALAADRIEGIVGVRYRLKVWGPFDLRSRDGRSIRPTVRKCCALLAILALSDGHHQSRKWLQTCLWSESDEMLGAGSLRQELARLKRLLGDAIRSDRFDIWLDAEQFDFDHLSDAPVPANADLLQGMDINDEAFEDWIREQRQYYLNHPKPAAPVQAHDPLPGLQPRVPHRHFTLIFDCDAKGCLQANVAALLFSEQLYHKLSQYDVFTCIGHDRVGQPVDPPSGKADSVAAIIRISSFANSKEVCLGVVIDSGPTGSRVGYDSVILPHSMSRLHRSPEIGRLVNQTVDTLLDQFVSGNFPAGGAVEAMLLTTEARRLIFRLDRASLTRADKLLARAYELVPRGQVIGWRAFLRNTAFFQHRTCDLFEEHFGSEELALEALRQAPNDALVQAFSAQLDYVNQGNLVESMIKARRAVELDRSDPMARALMSNALTVNGLVDEGYHAALQSVSLTKGGPYEFYFHHFACMAATAAGKYEIALRHARTSVSYSPDFVSPRRYEVALTTRLGDRAGADRAIAAMRRSEPDFDASMMLEQTYPVNTLRRLPIIEALV